MEVGSEGEKKQQPPEGETKSKRKMKTASQLEVLEKTYAVDNYPSEAVRAELSVQLGLSDRQLQMWFCHRRLKDRKGPPAKRQKKDSPSSGQPTGSHELAGNDLSPFSRGVHGSGADVAAMKRYYEMPPAPPPLLPPLKQQNVAEMRAIAFVEAQLGERLREDGPILGMEFDPLPPGAFGAPIGSLVGGRQNQPVHPFETKLYERPDTKPAKVASRPLHEYQFLPEQPTVRSDTYERAASSSQYSLPSDALNSRTPTLSIAHPLIPVKEQVSPGHGFPGQLPNINLLPSQSRQSHLLPSATGEHENVSRKNSISTATDPHFVAQPVALESHFMTSERKVIQNEDVLRIEKKRKSEEARIAREIEAHEKRIRKELEKQDMLRRKREEQIRKEMERQDRERRKEEERLSREKQREEERYLREQRRELERREKLLLKESIRAEKMRQKEELRREKEAARIKAANKRAIARRAAKELMELLDDEQLELMELAASRKGLSTIMSLDGETLQNLDLLRDMMCTFPPKSVHLKKPFAVQPWNGSEENVGNLFMVWRFLITFADVLGLWPFTLDELVQAFHDYDPRLLGEIHMALLRSIIKDIEDAAKTPFAGSGANQSSSTNPVGGHPQIVEGAYAWGFDIRSWQRHLNVLTWPEVLRQFALSAGFGPQLKKRNVEPTYFHDDNEGDNGKDIISNLRNGAAAENAVAIMQERGFSNGRRSRHLLTPGTVKFAAFHVLSLEGSKGLTILEVADKIQKSGLRDLTTSKTPEASIAAALSRDTKLFERVAPSTYCVRSPYRKDPSDAEEILSAARERIHVYKCGTVDEEVADEVERDGGDPDSESDVGEDPEVDLNQKVVHDSQMENSSSAYIVNGNKKEISKDMKALQAGLVGCGLSSLNSEDVKAEENVGLFDQFSSAAETYNGASAANQADTDVDESSPGESWVEGLTEGEYSDLTVEERLNALVALIGVAIEGNSIRVVLEERLEAANALKKQMWAEAQLDKRRTKEEYVWKMHCSSYMGSKTDPSFSVSSAERPNQLGSSDDKNKFSLDLNVQQDRLPDPQEEQNCLSIIPPEGNLQMHDYSVGSDSVSYHQPTYIAEKSRAQLKSFIGHKAEEMYVYRSLPLGQDRRRNRYWRFVTSASWRDPGCGRIFVELLDGRWRLIDSEVAFDALLASLDLRGVRESHLHSMLLKIEMSFKENVRSKKLHAKKEKRSQEAAKGEAMEMTPGLNHSIHTDSPCSIVCNSDSDMQETSTSFVIDLGRNEAEKGDALKRYQDFEKWMWQECISSSILCAMQYGKKRCKQLLGTCEFCHDVFFFEDNHCQYCHRNFVTDNDSSFPEHVIQCKGKLKDSVSSPLRIRLLKALLAVVEVSVPAESLHHVWTDDFRKSWGMKLHLSVSARELVQVLTQLENAIERSYLSSNFETTNELLHLSNPSACTGKQSNHLETVSVLPWMPQTTAGVALRLMELDDAISYTPNQKRESQSRGIIKLPAKYTVARNTRVDETMGTPYQTSKSQEANWVYFENGSGSSHKQGTSGRGRRRTATSGRSQKRVVGSRSVAGRKSSKANSDLLVWKGRSGGKGGRKCGRRSNRNRKKPAAKKAIVAPKESIFETPSESVRDDEWDGDEITELPVEDAENASTSSERSEYDDETGEPMREEYDTLVGLHEYGGSYNGRSEDFAAVSDDNMDGDEEDEEEGAEQEADFNIEGYINEEESDEEEMKDEDPDGNQALDGNTGSTSSDYSD